MKFHFCSNFWLILLITLFLSSCSNDPLVSGRGFIISKRRGKKMIKQCSRSTPESIASFWDPTLEDIYLLEANFDELNRIFDGSNPSPDERINTDDYAFQYIGTIIDNKKYIYLNASILKNIPMYSLVRDLEILPRTPMITCDGGSKYWGALFNMEDQTFSQISLNGPIPTPIYNYKNPPPSKPTRKN